MIGPTLAGPMADPPRSGWAFRLLARTHATPLAGLFLAALLLIGVTLHLAAKRQDAVQLAHEERVVAASLRALEGTLADTLVDYAVWDDAFEHLALAFDRDWARRNVGAALHETFGYDVSLVIGHDDRARYGRVGSVEDFGRAADVLGPAMAALIGQARRRGAAAPEPAVAVLAGSEGLRLVAAGAIVPEPGSPLQVPPGPPAVLLFAKPMDAGFLGQVQHDFGLSPLTIAAGDAAAAEGLARVGLRGPDGEDVGSLVWTPRRPGRDQLAWLAPALAGALLAIGVFVAFMVRETRLAEALRSSEGRLRDFAEVSSDWLWETDDQLRFAWFSPSFTRVTGFRPEDLLGRRREELRVSCGKAEDWSEHLADLAAFRPFRDFTYSLQDEAGRTRVMRISGKPIFDGAGRFVCYRGAGRDITQGWTAVQRLRESESRFRSLVENLRGIVFCRGVAGDGPHGYDEHGTQVFGADAARLTGAVDEKQRAKIAEWRDAVHPVDRAGYVAAERRRKEDGEPYTLEYRITHPATGEERWIREVAWVVEVPEEGRRYLDSHIIDITEQRQQNQELDAARRAAETATQAKSDFLAAMSHEIRTPMTGVLGMADLLALEPLSPAQKDYVETIRNSGRHLLSIINSVLDFSRIEAGRLELERVDFAVAGVLEQVRSLMAPQASERGLELRVASTVGESLVVRGDPTRLRQVLVNLIGNGLKFTARGAVAVSVERGRAGGDGSAVVLRFGVRDTGIGIPRERQAELFEAFVQADRSIARRYGGSGLGLAICKRLVAAMGGAMGVESEPGRGSLFWFEVPFAPGDAVAAATAGKATPEPDRVRPLRVLVADDVPANRELLGAMLGRRGHEVAAAEDGAAAVALAAEGRFDAVLMDVHMPVMDGLEATRRIRRLPPPAGALPILALTADVMAAERERCLAAGMDRCLTKPVVWPELFAALADAAARGGPSATAREAAGEPSATAPLSATADVPLLDQPLLEGMARELPKAAVRNLLARGLEGAGESCRRLKTSLGDAGRMAQESHRLRGTAGTFGFARVSALAGMIEDQAGRGEDAAGLVAELEDAVGATRAAVGRSGLGA